jgi:hypothetical protein
MMIALRTVFNDVIVQQVIVVSFIAGIEGITSYIDFEGTWAPGHFGRPGTSADQALRPTRHLGTSGELAKGERLVA